MRATKEFFESFRKELEQSSTPANDETSKGVPTMVPNCDLTKEIDDLRTKVHLLEKQIAEKEQLLQNKQQELNIVCDEKNKLKLEVSEKERQNNQLIKEYNLKVEEESLFRSMKNFSTSESLTDEDYATALWGITIRFFHSTKSKSVDQRTKNKEFIQRIMNELKLDSYLDGNQKYLINQFDDVKPILSLDAIQEIRDLEDFKNNHRFASYIKLESKAVKVRDWIREKIIGEQQKKMQILPVKAAMECKPQVISRDLPKDVYCEEFGLDISGATWDEWIKGYRNKRFNEEELSSYITELQDIVNENNKIL